MRSFRRMFVSAVCGLLLSVAAYAVPINVESYAVTVPNTVSLGQDDNAVMTHNDFVVTAPYVVVLDTATPVPIVLANGSTEFVTLNQGNNLAVMQNANFERMLYAA